MGHEDKDAASSQLSYEAGMAKSRSREEPSQAQGEPWEKQNPPAGCGTLSAMRCSCGDVPVSK